MTKFDQKIALFCLLFLAGILGIWVWGQSRMMNEISEKTIFFVGARGDQAGKLMIYNPETDQTRALTRGQNIVNEYFLHQTPKGQKWVYSLEVAKKHFSDSTSILRHQRLFALELQTGKKREIPLPEGVEITKLLGQVVDGQVYAVSKTGIWRWHLQRRKWSNLYSDLPLQDASISGTGRMILAASERENLGYILLALDQTSPPKPIGNFFQNFGFSPRGTQLLLKQKPEQDIFSDDSFLVVFGSEGTATEQLQNYGEIVAAVWGGEGLIFAIASDQNFEKTLLSLNLKTGEVVVRAEFGDLDVQWAEMGNGKIWITALTAPDFAELAESSSISETLDSLSPLLSMVFSFDPATNQIKKWPFFGFFPRGF